MPPTSPARCMTMSGRATLYTRLIASISTRLYSLLRGIKISRQPFCRSFSTTNDPRNPAPPVTTTRLFGQKASIASFASIASVASIASLASIAWRVYCVGCVIATEEREAFLVKRISRDTSDERRTTQQTLLTRRRAQHFYRPQRSTTLNKIPIFLEDRAICQHDLQRKFAPFGCQEDESRAPAWLIHGWQR